MVRSKVLFPEPVGPRMAVTCPPPNGICRSDSTARWPKLSVRSTQLTTASPAAAGVPGVACVPGVAAVLGVVCAVTVPGWVAVTVCGSEPAGSGTDPP